MTLILMIIIIKIFSGIFLCTLLGTILYLFWKAAGRLIEHKGYVDINYLIWKMVLLMFAIPITLIYANGFEKSTYVFEVTGPIKWVIGILMIIWLVGTIIFTIRFLEKYRAIRKDILNADPCGDEIQSMVKSISKKLGVHKEIQVVILEKAGGPMLYGILKSRIILPRIYDPQQLNMIFTHELIHYKHHDLIWKHLANIICCVYWFQPALKDVFYQLDQWGETYCDRTVCEYLPDVKGYFSTIIDISMEEIRYGRYTTAGLYESKEVLKLRMERMKSYRQQRRLRRGISVSVLFGMIILSAATVFASGIGFVKTYDKIADETREEINVGTEGDIKDQKAKYRMYDKTRIKKCMIKNERLKENDGKPFTWKIKPKDIVKLGVDGVNQIWRDAKLRAAGLKRAKALVTAAEHSIGSQEACDSARIELKILLNDYEIYHQREEELMELIEEKLSEVPYIDKLLEIKGIGMKTVSGFVAEVGDIKRFDNPKQLHKLAGYAIVECSSGKHKGESHISYRGRKRLRYVLYEAAISLIARNTEFKEIHRYYQTRGKNSLKKMQSVIAVACKALRIFYAILTKGVTYDGAKMLQDIKRPQLKVA